MQKIPFNQKFLTLDVETEGLDLTHGHPWQISWNICQGDKILIEHDRLVDWPKMKMAAEVAQLNHFNEAEYKARKEPARKVWDDLKRDLFNENYLIIGQNLLGFDCYLLKRIAEECGERIDRDFWSFLNRIFDTRSLSRAYRDKTALPQNRRDFLAWQYKMLSEKGPRNQGVSLSTMTKLLGLPYDANLHHNALEDVRMTYRLFKALQKALDI